MSAPPTAAAARVRSRSERAPLADRLLVLGGVRLATVGVVVAAMLLAPDVAGRLDGGLQLAAMTYALVAVVAEAGRGLVSVRAIGLVNLMLVLDGVWVAYVLAR